MTDQMDVLRRDYLPDELLPVLSASGFDGCVAVQARQMLEETEWLLDLAGRYSFIRGVVGWVDLRSAEVVSELEGVAVNPKLAGVRHVVHDEPDDRFMLRPDFQRGIGCLSAFGLTYDLLLFPKHLPIAENLVAKFPNQKFVLDHIAKPPIREGKLAPWRDDLIRLADRPNVFCKLSGMVTEAQWRRWRPEDFHRYLDVVFDAFGPLRVMIGSDWPVCTLSGSYHSTVSIVMDYVKRLPAATQEDVLGETCSRVYNLRNRST